MDYCENCCRRRKWNKTGRFIDGRIEWQCAWCGHKQLSPPPQGIRIPPKVLYIDIETARFTAQVKTFSLNVPSQRLSWKFITKPFFVLCWSAGWIENDSPPKHILSDVVTSREAKRRNDKRVMQGMWELLNKADYVIGHNSKKFDSKKLNTRFLANHIPLPIAYQERDTLQLAKKYYSAESNCLEYWSLRLGGDGKDRMQEEDWELCEAGDERALRKMERYNRGDVRNGINVYLEFKQSIEAMGRRLYR